MTQADESDLPEGDAEEDGGALPERPAAPRPAPPPRPRAQRFSGRSERFGTVPFPVKAHVSPHGQVTAVSMMKDEGPYVIEWVAHQIAIGFTDIVVYTNDCTDGTDCMLMRLEELGLVHHRANVIPEGLRPQPSALNHAQEEPVVQASDWLMVFDADEFLSIRHGDGTLDDLIAAAVERGATGIVVTWRIFGSGGVTAWSRQPVTEQYLRAAPAGWNKGWGVKTLFQFHPDRWRLGIHRPKMRNRLIDTTFPDEIVWLNGSGRVMDEYFKFRGWRSIARNVGHDWVQLNHYAVKSAESYAVRKLRGNVNFKADKYNSDYWALQDRNEVIDETQLRYRDRRAAIMAALLDDPVLRALHEAAVAGVEAKLEELRRTEAFSRFLAELAEASARPIGEIAAKPPQPRDKAKIAAMMTEVERRRVGEDKARRIAPATANPAASPVLSETPYLQRLPARLEPSDVAWHPNRGVELPADPRVFTPLALRAIAAGKFERGLARRLPEVMPRDARVLEIGAGCGFLAAQLCRARPDLVLTVQEQVAALGQIMDAVLARNGAGGGRPLRVLGPILPGEGEAEIAGPLRSLIGEERPDVLILSDHRLSVGVCSGALGGADVVPPLIVVAGRMLERHREAPDRLDAVMRRLGLVSGDLIDHRLARAYAARD